MAALLEEALLAGMEERVQAEAQAVTVVAEKVRVMVGIRKRPEAARAAVV